MKLIITLIAVGAAAIAQDDKRNDFKGIDLFEIQKADPYPAGIVQRIVDGIATGEKGGASKRDLNGQVGLHAYRAEIVDPRKHKTALANLFLVRLGAPFAGGRLAVAVDEVGDIIAMDLMGHPGFS